MERIVRGNLRVTRIVMAGFIVGLFFASAFNITMNAAAAGPQTWTSTDPQKSITDYHWTVSFISISTAGELNDVNVEIIDIHHTYDADVNIYLVHPDGTNITLSDDNGGSGDNYINTIFDDEASNLITGGTAPFTGSYKPEESLSFLDGKELSGLWKLSIYDDYGGYTGYLAANGWSITAEYTPPNVPPGAPVLNSQLQMDNALVTTEEPRLAWYIPEDYEGSDMHFQVEVDDDSDFAAPLFTKFSSSDPTGFGGDPDNTPPYTSGGGSAWYDLQNGDNLADGSTYWWRVRAHDGIEFGVWSESRSFTIDTTAPMTAWFQTTSDQYNKDEQYQTIARENPYDDVIIESAEVTGEGMIAYGENLVSTPRYRLWDGSAWGSELSALNIGSDTIYYIILKPCPTRNEYALGAQTSDGHVIVQIYNAVTAQWGNLIEISTQIVAPYQKYRGFDLAYETVSGNLIAAVNNNAADPIYYIWDGTSWSGPTTIDMPTTGKPMWIELESNPASDEIIMATLDTYIDVTAAVWDGSSWGNTITLETSAETFYYEGFDIAYEQLSKDAMVIWTDGALSTPEYVFWEGTAWGTPSAAPSTGTADIKWITLSPDPSSDRIAMGVYDGGYDINANIWDGDAWGTDHEISNQYVSSEPIFTKRLDTAFEHSGDEAIVAWNVGEDGNSPSSNSLPDYTRYTTSWQANQEAQNIGGMARVFQLIQNPINDEFMIVIGDNTEDLNVQRWTGSAWTGNIEMETTLSSIWMWNWAYEGFMFAYRTWYPSPSTGTLTSTPIDYDDNLDATAWGDVQWTETSGGGTSDATITVQYWDGVGWSDIEEKSSSESPISLYGLDTSTYNKIRLIASFDVGSGSSPELEDWKVTWITDSDNDLWWNWEELELYGTNPYSSDTDQDGIPDTDEIKPEIRWYEAEQLTIIYGIIMSDPIASQDWAVKADPNNGQILNTFHLMPGYTHDIYVKAKSPTGNALCVKVKDNTWYTESNYDFTLTEEYRWYQIPSITISPNNEFIFTNCQPAIGFINDAILDKIAIVESGYIGYMTDPKDADTDSDGLLDGQETIPYGFIVEGENFMAEAIISEDELASMGWASRYQTEDTYDAKTIFSITNFPVLSDTYRLFIRGKNPCDFNIKAYYSIAGGGNIEQVLKLPYDYAWIEIDDYVFSEPPLSPPSGRYSLTGRDIGLPVITIDIIIEHVGGGVSFDGTDQNIDEVMIIPASYSGPISNPMDPDTDRDGLSDYTEVQQETNTLDTDTDDDGISDGTDPYPKNAAPTLELNIGAAEEGRSVTFDASSTYDREGDSIEFQWTFTYDGTPHVKPWSTSSHEDRTWNDEKNVNVLLEVRDSLGQISSKTTDVIVKNVAPSATIAGPFIVRKENNDIFIANFYDPGTSDTITVSWDMNGDDNYEIGNVNPLSYHWDDIGSRTIHLRVDDGDGGVTIASADVSVRGEEAKIGSVRLPRTGNLHQDIDMGWSLCNLEYSTVYYWSIDYDDGSPIYSTSYTGINGCIDISGHTHAWHNVGDYTAVFKLEYDGNPPLEESRIITILYDTDGDTDPDITDPDDDTGLQGGDGVPDTLDSDPLVDVKLTLEITEINVLDDVDILSKAGELYAHVYVYPRIDNPTNPCVTPSTQDPDWGDPLHWYTGILPENSHWISPSGWIHTFDTNDGCRFHKFRIQLWDWDDDRYDGHDLLDISRDTGGGDENSIEGSDGDFTYDLYTGRWINIPLADDWIDSPIDDNGYGHMSGYEDGNVNEGGDWTHGLDNAEIRFEIHQTDYDGDTIPYHREIDHGLDPYDLDTDNDGVPDNKIQITTFSDEDIWNSGPVYDPPNIGSPSAELDIQVNPNTMSIVIDGETNGDDAQGFLVEASIWGHGGLIETISKPTWFEFVKMNINLKITTQIITRESISTALMAIYMGIDKPNQLDYFLSLPFLRYQLSANYYELPTQVVSWNCLDIDGNSPYLPDNTYIFFPWVYVELSSTGGYSQSIVTIDIEFNYIELIWI